jgi:bacillithiol biosynthesis cysteine-adding enzyme BshC
MRKMCILRSLVEEHRGTRIMINLPFSSLPGMSRLYVDYCAGVPDICRYFLGHFSDLMAYETHLQVLERHEYNRQDLCAAILDQQDGFGAGEATYANIARLNEPTTFAVLTGQQVGLCTGPLYTIYKALTAVRMARWLGDQFPSGQFVPVFWLETEDHDLDEANIATIIDHNNDPASFSYSYPMDPGVKNMRPVGDIAFDNSIVETMNSLLDSLGETEFTPRLRSLLNASYTPGATFGSAFARLFNGLFPDLGLILVDPSDARLKRLLIPMILRELDTFPTASEEIIRRSAELEEQYHAQVKPRALNLFIRHRGNRYPLEPSEHDFFLRGSRQRYTKEELIIMAHETPEVFSPNVALRPIFQDHLFPTAACIAGPGEIAYFAQLQPVYDHFDVPMPVIVPRASISIVDKRLQKLMDRFELPFTGLYETPGELYHHYITTSSRKTDVAEFFRLRDQLLTLNKEIAGLSAHIDPNLQSPASASAERIQNALALLEQKLVASEQSRDETVQRQFEKCANIMMPNSELQERALNIISFYNRYGGEVLKRIDESCDPFPAEHRMLLL